MLSVKLKFVIVLPPILTVPSWSSSASAIILFEEGGGEQTSNCDSEPFSYVVVMVDCAGCFVVEALYYSDQVVIDLTQPQGCPQSCMRYSVERLVEVHEDAVKFLWCCRYFSQSILRLKIAQLSSFLIRNLPFLL